MNKKYLYRFLILSSLFCIFIPALTRFCHVTYNQLSYKYDLGFERPSGYIMVEAMKQDYKTYSPEISHKFPYLFSCYTPLYYYLLSKLPDFPENRFLMGRLLSLISFILINIIFLNQQNRSRSYLYLLIPLSLMLIFHSNIAAASYLKCDLFALLFSIIAIQLCSRRKQSALSFIIIAICSIFSFYSKQTYLAAAAATFTYSIFNLKYFSKYPVYFIIIVIISVVFATMIWGEGLWISVFKVPNYAWGIKNAVDLLINVSKQPVFIYLFLMTALSSFIVIKDDFKKYFVNPFSLYLLFSGGSLLLKIGVYGGSTNYFIEFYTAMLMWLTYYFYNHLSDSYKFEKKLTVLILLPLLILFSIEIKIADKSSYSFLTDWKIKRNKIMIDEIGDVLAKENMDTPLILSFVIPSYAYIYTDKLLVSDPYLLSRFWNCRFFDVNNIINDIIDQRFDLIILEKELQFKKNPAIPIDYIVNAIRTIYSVRKNGIYDYFLRNND